jgi:hypothetical protein
MATKDLITLDRAYLTLSGVSGVDAQLALLITAVSDAIEKYCRRRFVSTAFDELYNGSGNRRLLLRQYPLQSVQSVRYRPVTVIKITNNITANVQARVSVTSVGLKLFRSNAGVSSTDTSVTFAGNPTLSALVAAVNALGNGWSAQVQGDATNYGGWPSADLYVSNSYGDPLEGGGIRESQGATSAVGVQAELKMHTFELAGYQWDARGWLLRAIPYTDPELLHPEDLVWPIGINNFRIQYTAGYSTIPEAVQEACALWVSQLYYLSLRDIQLVNQVPSGGTAQGWAPINPTAPEPPAYVATLLAPYRRHTVATGQG